ncbi:MAG: MoaF N-terminal domain-containing protein [Clostridiales bacterium]|nr:MoaF N-terminal domain-containing protein [Clostridiales bacterium]
MKKKLALLISLVLLVSVPLSAYANGGNPFTDAFSVKYSPMTDAEVYEKLNALPSAPDGGGALSELSGNSYEIINDDGLAISLLFDMEDAIVSVSALLVGSPFAFPPAAPKQLDFKTEYAGLALNDYALVAFRVPESASVWALILNLATGQVTLYETFFAETIDLFFGGLPTPARDAQRTVYLAKLADSSPELPTLTDKLLGKVILWDNTLGSIYTHYGTPTWSAFYPLGQPEGLAGSWTAPSDYYDLKDSRHYLYSRTESVYSGATSVEVIDLEQMAQIGFKIGFDAADQPEFALYTGTGDELGTLSGGGSGAYDPSTVFRFAYRPNSEVLSREEVIQAMEDEGSWTGAFGGPGKEENMFPYTDKLVGMSFALEFDDGLGLEYEFTAEDELKFREVGASEWKVGRYESFEVDENLFFFTHAIDDNFPDKLYLNIVDFDNGLATCMNSEILVDSVTPRICVPSFHFGVLKKDGITPISSRHGFTTDLLGTAFTWKYNDAMTSRHFYATPDSLYYGILMDGEPLLMWSCDAWFVKFREDVFLISWLETFGSGQNDTKIFNREMMHDAGVCFGIPDGAPFEYNTFGSKASDAGQIDVSSIYGKDEPAPEPPVVNPPTYYAPSTYTPAPVATATPKPIAPPSVSITSSNVSLDELVKTAQPIAEALNNMKLLYGTGTDSNGKPVYQLEKTLTRMEALAFVLRLQGLEAEATAFSGANPFTDTPDWGKSLAAFAYSKGITFGVNDAHSLFDPNSPITYQQFTAFLLRVLGYQENSGDFKYEDALKKAVDIKMYSETEVGAINRSSIYRRAQAVLSMADSLVTTKKGSEKRLLDLLVDSGIVTKEAASAFLK